FCRIARLTKRKVSSIGLLLPRPGAPFPAREVSSPKSPSNRSLRASGLCPIIRASKYKSCKSHASVPHRGGGGAEAEQPHKIRGLWNRQRARLRDSIVLGRLLLSVAGLE